MRIAALLPPATSNRAVAVGSHFPKSLKSLPAKQSPLQYNTKVMPDNLQLTITPNDTLSYANNNHNLTRL